MSTNEYAPCQLVDRGNGRYSVVLTEFDQAADVFAEAGFEAGGYAWHGVVEALISMRAKGLKRKVKFDPESSMFVAYGKDLESLKMVVGLIRDAMNDRALLREALKNADPDLMD